MAHYHPYSKNNASLTALTQMNNNLTHISRIQQSIKSKDNQVEKTNPPTKPNNCSESNKPSNKKITTTLAILLPPGSPIHMLLHIWP
jgi:hypothetical protein